LPLTGERTVPGVAAENYWFRRHEAAYRWLATPSRARRVVVEAGCGEGYGGQLLADAGAAVVAGLDLDLADAAARGGRLSRRAGGRCQPGRAAAGRRAVDLVVCSQVVEHLWDQDAFVAECARVLRPGGRLVVTTPNRRPSRPATSSTPASWTRPSSARCGTAPRGAFRVGTAPRPRLAADQAENGDLVAARDRRRGDLDRARRAAGGGRQPPPTSWSTTTTCPVPRPRADRRTPVSEPVGTLCIVLHTHLPWLPRHGSWPVGEECCTRPGPAATCRCWRCRPAGREGRRDLSALGVTPVLAAALDDPYALREHHGWLGRWQLRAEELARAARAGAAPDGPPRSFRAASHALEVFETRWRHGGSAALRPLLDAGTVELLGGPLTHPILPLLPPEVTAFALHAGLDDAALRLGRRPRGIWAAGVRVGRRTWGRCSRGRGSST
jgi:SAM-dependent methyltransferase